MKGVQPALPQCRGYWTH